MCMSVCTCNLRECRCEGGETDNRVREITGINNKQKDGDKSMNQHLR